MADMRNYKDAIKRAVAAERKADEYYSWNIVSIKKAVALIGWSYLSPKDGCFMVEAHDEESDNIYVTGTLPNGRRIYKTVGDTRWDDSDTIEGAVAAAIRGMARVAHSIY